MEAAKIHEFARELREAHGEKAIHEAAQKASGFESQGDNEQAKVWRSIEKALREMAGPHES